MKTFIQNGEVVQLVAPYTVTSGSGTKVGAIFGVASTDIANGAAGEYKRTGVFSLPKTSAQAWSQGDRIYWDDTNKRCDNVPTTGMFIGVALSAAANPSSTGTVLLTPGPALATGPGADVADVTTANAVDLATAEALANQLKTSLNALLDALRTSGVIQ